MATCPLADLLDSLLPWQDLELQLVVTRSSIFVVCVSFVCDHLDCVVKVAAHVKPTLKEFVLSVGYIAKNKDAEVLVMIAFTANKILELDQLEGVAVKDMHYSSTAVALCKVGVRKVLEAYAFTFAPEVCL